MQTVTAPINTLPDRSDATLTHISENVSFRWLYNGQAYEIITTSARREAIDAYIDTNLAVINQWDSTQPFYSFQDISHKDVSITPYFKARLNDVAVRMAEQGVEGISMVILNNGFSGNLMKLLSRFFVNRIDSAVTQIWFTDADKAYAELEKHIQSGK
jgi:hypothetical protein